MTATQQEVTAKIDFLADIPLYYEQKPFHFHVAATKDVNPEDVQITNVQWDARPVTIHSMRDRADISIDSNGFRYINHTSDFLPYDGAKPDIVSKYEKETEEMLRSTFDASFVHCYDYKRRKNVPMMLDEYDPTDPLLVEEAAKGAHDISVDAVARLIRGLLTEEQQHEYLRPGYRFRLINTWRSLLPICEDRPLTVCDYSSIDGHDLVATDRVYPTWLQEIYHIKYNAEQRWYWLPGQLPTELLMFLTYDSQSTGSNARYCPHVSFCNPLAGPSAPPRESVETRNLIITKLEP